MKRFYLCVLLLCFLAGAGLYAFSFHYPWYTSEDAPFEISMRLEDKPRDERWEQWYEELKKIETPRKTLHDTGVGLVALSAMLLAFFLLSGFPLKHARTPGKWWAFILIYLLTINVQPPLAFMSLSHRLERHDFPTWGDTIIIGLAQTQLLCYFFTGIGMLLLIPIVWKSRLPARIFLWPKTHPAANTIFTLIFTIPSLLCLWDLPVEIADGSIGGVIMATTLIYLFMSARAGLLNDWIEKDRTADGEVTEPAGERSIYETPNQHDHAGCEGSG